MKAELPLLGYTHWNTPRAVQQPTAKTRILEDTNPCVRVVLDYAPAAADRRVDRFPESAMYPL